MTLTLPEALEATIGNFGNRPAIYSDDVTLTWEAFGDRIARLSRVLSDCGVRRGDRFAIIAKNSHRFDEMKWAGFWVGVVPVPVNWRLAPREIYAVLEDCDARLLVVDPEHLPLVQLPEFARWHDRILVLAQRAEGTAMAVEELIANAMPRSPVACAGDDVAILFYTGGTTGRSKGVQITHGNLAINALQGGVALSPRQSDVYLHITPMFHAAELLATPWLLSGAAHVYLPGFVPERMLGVIERYGVTSMNIVPTMLIRLLSEPGFAQRDVSSLRTILFGSSSMTADWVARLVRTLPQAQICSGYGLTETAPNATMLEPELLRAAVLEGKRPELVGSVGKPLVGMSIRIADEAGNEVARGTAGEILMKGPNVMKGYHNRPEETAKALRGGWLHTGDFGHLDDDGNLYVLDRIKDMIISGGENVYSAEVETALAECGDVEEVAVFGVPDEVFGEAVCAAVVVKPGAAVSADRFGAFCRERIAAYKVPRLFAFVDALPRTSIGKIAKGELRIRFAERAGLVMVSKRG